jgi:hypothetical protein
MAHIAAPAKPSGIKDVVYQLSFQDVVASHELTAVGKESSLLRLHTGKLSAGLACSLNIAVSRANFRHCIIILALRISAGSTALI